MKKGLWNDNEVKDLFETIEKAKKGNQALKEAFVSHAKKYSRQPNSVRNYYYHEVDNLWKDKKRAFALQIDLTKHQKTSINYFSEEQEQALMNKIKSLVASGYSVRKACFTLENGNVGEMLRYQNKYRNYISKSSPKKQDNIIKFSNSKHDKLTENDINSLFLGLVRIVKRSAMDEVASKFKEEKENANTMLRKAIVDLNKKEKEIAQLKEMFKNLKNQNAKLAELVNQASCDKASKLRKKLSCKKDAIIEG